MKFKSILAVTILASLFSCNSNKDWDIEIPEAISASSPVAVDLNDDGIKDIVMGAGGQEWAETQNGILAINGVDGSVLWKAPARNQIVGTAVFADLNGDKTPDVIIGGRSAELQARNGKTGELLWEIYSKKGMFAARADGWFNFYNVQILPDQDQDGVSDILASNGGDAIIPPGMKDRPAGKLFIFSGKTGRIIANDEMPDKQETYFSPILLDDSNDPQFIFGSGGESKAGHLYLCKLSDLKNKNLAKSTILDSTINKGYVSPPILADFNRDGKKDIVVCTAEGKVKLIDGKSLKVVWEQSQEGTEMYAQAGIGHFYGNDKTLDVMVTFAKGTYPDYSSTERVLLDGKTGKVVKSFPDKYFTYSSPLVVDLDNNGTDEVIFNTVKDTLLNGKDRSYYQLTVYDFANNTTQILDKKHIGGCFASTPWLGDLKNNGTLSLIYSGSPSTSPFFPGNTTFERPELKLFVHKITLKDVNPKSLKWGQYMGKEGKSWY